MISGLLALTLGAGALPVAAQTILAGGTVNSADYTRSFAPGAVISIFGTKLATSTTNQLTPLPWPNSLSGTSVNIATALGATPIPVFYVSPGQINAQLPFSLAPGTYALSVTSPAGTTNVDSIVVAAAAPKFYTLDFSGSGSAVATTPSYQILTSALPAKPADSIVLWMNSLGATTGTPVAGQAAPGATPGSQPLTMVTQPLVSINGLNAPVTFAGLTPGASGLYQINVKVPFVTLTGPVVIQVNIPGAAGVVSSQTSVTVPFQQLGFYSALLGGKAVAGQTLTAVSGSSSAVAYKQFDTLTWGTNGFNAWTNNTGLSSVFSASPGLALTMMNGNSVVYDNNGIESGTAGTFYNNTGGPANSQKPGLSDFYSMSNYFPLVWSGYFKLAQQTTITKLIGYFDIGNPLQLPFDPANPYVKYRMNIWSMGSGNLPTDTGSNFVGDKFTSDTAAGTFSYSDTGLKMISSVSTDYPKPIYRLAYTLNTPLVLPAGEYWFSHDASARTTPASSSTAAVRLPQLTEFISRQKVSSQSYTFSFFGREMQMSDSYVLPEAVEVHPAAPVEIR